jgi:hypothetical protein
MASKKQKVRAMSGLSPSTVDIIRAEGASSQPTPPVTWAQRVSGRPAQTTASTVLHTNPSVGKQMESAPKSDARPPEVGDRLRATQVASVIPALEVDIKDTTVHHVRNVLIAALNALDTYCDVVFVDPTSPSDIRIDEHIKALVADAATSILPYSLKILGEGLEPDREATACARWHGTRLRVRCFPRDVVAWHGLIPVVRQDSHDRRVSDCDRLVCAWKELSITEVFAWSLGNTKSITMTTSPEVDAGKALPHENNSIEYKLAYRHKQTTAGLAKHILSCFSESLLNETGDVHFTTGVFDGNRCPVGYELDGGSLNYEDCFGQLFPEIPPDWLKVSCRRVNTGMTRKSDVWRAELSRVSPKHCDMTASVFLAISRGQAALSSGRDAVYVRKNEYHGDAKMLLSEFKSEALRRADEELKRSKQTGWADLPTPAIKDDQSTHLREAVIDRYVVDVTISVPVQDRSKRRCFIRKSGIGSTNPADVENEKWCCKLAVDGIQYELDPLCAWLRLRPLGCYSRATQSFLMSASWRISIVRDDRECETLLPSSIEREVLPLLSEPSPGSRCLLFVSFSFIHSADLERLRAESEGRLKLVVMVTAKELINPTFSNQLRDFCGRGKDMLTDVCLVSQPTVPVDAASRVMLGGEEQKEGELPLSDVQDAMREWMLRGQPATPTLLKYLMKNNFIAKRKAFVSLSNMIESHFLGHSQPVETFSVCSSFPHSGKSACIWWAIGHLRRRHSVEMYTFGSLLNEDSAIRLVKNLSSQIAPYIIGVVRSSTYLKNLISLLTYAINMSRVKLRVAFVCSGTDSDLRGPNVLTIDPYLHADEVNDYIDNLFKLFPPRQPEWKDKMRQVTKAEAALERHVNVLNHAVASIRDTAADRAPMSLNEYMRSLQKDSTCVNYLFVIAFETFFSHTTFSVEYSEIKSIPMLECMIAPVKSRTGSKWMCKFGHKLFAFVALLQFRPELRQCMDWGKRVDVATGLVNDYIKSLRALKYRTDDALFDIFVGPSKGVYLSPLVKYFFGGGENIAGDAEKAWAFFDRSAPNPSAMLYIDLPNRIPCWTSRAKFLRTLSIISATDMFFDRLIEHAEKVVEGDGSSYSSRHFLASCRAYCAPHWSRPEKKVTECRAALEELARLRLERTTWTDEQWKELLNIELTLRYKIARRRVHCAIDEKAMLSFEQDIMNVLETESRSLEWLRASFLLSDALEKIEVWSDKTRLIPLVERALAVVSGENAWNSVHTRLAKAIKSSKLLANGLQSSAHAHAIDKILAVDKTSSPTKTPSWMGLGEKVACVFR